MKDHQDRWGQLLLILAMGLSLFVLGCGVKQLTTEVREDGSGRNVFVLAWPKPDAGTEDAAGQEEDLEQMKEDIEACGAQTLPYADDRYEGYQAIFNFSSFSEVPGQISCLLGDTTGLQIEGLYDEGALKKTYHLEVRLAPSGLWMGEDDSMLYRVIMPGRIVAYDDMQTAHVRTVKDTSNQVSWYFASGAEGEDDSETEYVVTVRAEKSMVPASDWLTYGGIFVLASALIMGVGVVAWKVIGAAAKPHPKGTRPAQGVQPERVPPGKDDYPTLGSVLDRYQIREELGRGGMAVVYRARHQTLERDVALKILAPHLTVAPGFVERFREEGRILAQLSHPHIVAVHDAGCVQGTYYLAMELVRGLSLERALQKWGRLEPRQAVAIALQIAQALDYAHRNGVIHRDIKPANILLDETWRVKVADFGIVAILGERQVATSRIGTPRYMAYEQFCGAATPQSDLYSLAACLYEMLTGECPPAFGLQATVPPSQFNQAVSPVLDRAVLKCLQPDPAQRYATVRAFMDALRQA